MFTKLTDTSKAAIFTLLVLFLSVGAALSINMLDLGSNMLMWASVWAITPVVATLIMLLVVTRDGYSREGWKSLGLHRPGLEGAIRGQRPGAEVSLVQARQIAGEVRRFDPHLVVSGLPNTVDPGGRAAWVTLSEDPDEPSELCVVGRRRGARNPGMEELLAVIDETGGLVRTGGRLGGC